MLLLKKLCRFNASSSSSSPAAQSPSQPGYTDADLNENGHAADDWPTGAYRIEQAAGVQQRRTPPPLYHSLHSLPSTPPPSYTEPSHRRLTRPPLHNCHDPEVPAPQVCVDGVAASQPAELSGLGSGQPAGQRQAEQQQQPPRHQQQEPLQQENLQQPCQHHLQQPSQHLLPQPHHHHQQQHQEQVAARRRQRLHSLQRRQARLLVLHRRPPATSEDSDSSSSSSSRASENEASRQRQPYPSKQHRQRYRGLRDVYCPDILNACSLILHQQQWRPGPEDSSDSSVRNFTDSPAPPAEHSSDDDKLRGHNERRRGGEAREGDLDLSGTPATEGPATRYQRLGDEQPGQMGQNLSLRRPRISLTWVLREQQQQQQEQRADQGSKNDSAETAKEKSEAAKVEVSNNNNGVQQSKGYGVKEEPEGGASLPNGVSVATTTHASKKRYRLKQLPSNGDPLNGYATTPTAYTGAGPPSGNGLPEQKFFSNQNLLDYRAEGRDPKLRPATKELFFVCTPQRLPNSLMPTSLKHAGYEAGGDTLALAKKRNEIRKRLAVLQSSQHHQHLGGQQKRPGDGAEMPPPEKSVAAAASSVVQGACKDDYKSLKGTYSEPSLIAASEGVHHRRHRHRKRRERQRQTPKFGYEIANVEEFLAKCSLASPANIPVVLAAATTLYQTKPGGYQAEVALPLGMVVNAVFKNQNWLYVQTPHAEEGYVGYKFCLPLGILPTASGAKPQPCWESNGDVFPRPCGNMTDSEKEIHLRGGTRSDGARTPRGAAAPSMGGPTKTVSHNPLTGAAAASEGDAATDEVNGNGGGHHVYGEHQVDKLYLRAASQAKIVEKTAAYAQLRSTQSAAAMNEEYGSGQQKQYNKQQRSAKQSQQGHKPKPTYATNGQNGQHLHPNPQGPLSVRAHPIVLAAPLLKGPAASRHKHELRQTLVAISVDYRSDSISLQKGEIVTLRECRVSKDNQQWFYVRTRDGREGFIPAEVAGHGYL